MAESVSGSAAVCPIPDCTCLSAERAFIRYAFTCVSGLLSRVRTLRFDVDLPAVAVIQEPCFRSVIRVIPGFIKHGQGD